MKMTKKSIRTDVFEGVTVDFEKMEYRYKEWAHGLPFKIVDREIHILKYPSSYEGKTPPIPLEHQQEWHRDQYTVGEELDKLLAAYDEYINEVMELELLSVDNA
jgi:hypothetical protein